MSTNYRLENWKIRSLPPIFQFSNFLIFYLLGLTFSSAQSQQSINGSKLFVKTSGSGEPLVVIHGGPGLNQSYLVPHLNALAKKYTMVYYDQRASGKSATPSPDSISLQFFADDIEALRKNLGIEKLNLLAHSWGALPAISYCLRYPENVKHLILCNPVPLSHEYDQRMTTSQAAKSSLRDSTDRSIIMGSRDFKSGKTDAYRRLLLLSFRHSFYKPSNFSKLSLDLPDNFASASQALYTGLGKELAQYDYYDSIKGFKFPVLILHGGADAIPLEAVSRMATSMPRAKLVVMPKSSHFVFIDQAGKFRRAVRLFLKD